ncbi:MAG: hypothetical protein K2I22_15910 [Lachnospiraceae bacterium]|nr:hypothetical protein [Lachnospiraceae bacterium]
MKFRSMKKMMAAALVAALVMSPASMVHAADVSGNDVSGNGSSTGTPAAAVQTPAPIPTFEEKMSQTAQAPISVAGTEIKTSVAGVYGAMSVSGTAVSTSAEDVKTALALTEEQTPAIVIYDVDPKKSVNAMASIHAGAEATGTEIVACLHIELGARESGKWITLSDGNVALVAGLPKSADTSLTYLVLCVQEGGVITVLEDLDTNPDTVTFAVEAGLGAYAIVAK